MCGSICLYGRPESIAHATSCVVRLVRLCLGPNAVADRKVEWGPSLTILGIELSLSKEGYQCRLSRNRAEKCIKTMREALLTGRLACCYVNQRGRGCVFCNRHLVGW